MSKIILKITPVDGYFFGSENRRSDDTVNYFLKSFTVPQQSTMLGAIRYMFLKFVAGDAVFKDNKIVDKEAAKKMIGEKSFNLNETDFKMGKITSISEVFLLKNDTPFLPAPFDAGLEGINFIQDSGIPDIANYSAKEHYPKKFASKDDPDLVKSCCIFKEVIQSGNKKDNKGDDDDDAYYKQQYYRLSEGWSFGVELESDDESLKKFEKEFFVNMGGENKLFKIEKLTGVSLNKDEIIERFKHSKLYKIVLISDTYFKDDPYKNCLFAFSKTKSFRNLKSTVDDTKKYQNRSSSDNESMNQSGLVELMESGSVFYFKTNDEAEKFKKQIDNEYLSKAGMNKYVLIQPKTVN